jgi:uncharacterized membrane protein YedE/YeeE
MYESLGLSMTAPEAAVLFGLALGLAFGALAQISRFCLRRAVAGDAGERRPAGGVWALALATALLAVQGAVAAGWIGFADHRFLSSDLPVLAIVLGGLAFGAGMVLTRGCMSRQTVLLASGNLRSLTVLLVFAVVAHATLKGILAPLRTAVGSVTVPLGEVTSLAALPGGALAWTLVLAAGLVLFALRSGARPRDLVLAVGIGALAAVGWIGTGYVFYDEFDPVALESLSFTSPAAETIFWTLASSAVPATFGVGLVGGTLLGAFLAALVRREVAFQSFESPRQTGRYLTGAALMGVGGVLAGGCTVGAGLSGVPTLSVAAILALVSIIAGGAAMDRALGVTRPTAGSAGQAGRPGALPAE